MIGGTGLSPEDIATEVWRRAYMGEISVPQDAKGTDAVIKYLVPFVRHEFLDRARKQQDGKKTLAWQREVQLKPTGSNRKPEPHQQPDVDWHEVRERLLAVVVAAPDNALLTRYVELQVTPDGFMGFSRHELAVRLEVDESIVTNLKRRLQALLLRAYPSLSSPARAQSSRKVKRPRRKE